MIGKLYGSSCSRYFLRAMVALSLLLVNTGYAVTSNGVTRVQSVSAQGTNVAKVSQSFNASTIAGDLILVFVRMTTTVQTVTIRDTAGNTFLPAVSQKQTKAGYQVALYYALNAKSGPDTVTASFSNINAHPWLALYEYSGVNALDTFAHGQGVGANLSTGAAPQTSVANELVFTGFGFPAASAAAFVPGSGFTLDQQQPAQGWSRAATEVATVATAGTYAGSASLNGTSYWAGVIATFKHKVISNPSPVTVSVTPNATSVQVKSTKQFTASVTASNTSVAWAVNGVQGGNPTYGTINSSGLFVAPATVPGGGNAVVTATSMADTTKSASATVDIVNPTGQVGVSVTPGSASVGGGQSQQFTANVTGTANTAVNWSVNGAPGGNSTVGTITAEGYYTAPPCPTASSVQVTATSVYDGTTSASSAVTLTSASASNIRYVSVNGSDSNNGSACSPWATIQHAAKNAQPGQTILVGDGTYPEQVTIMNSGTANGWITFKSVNKWGAKIAPTTLASYGWVLATGGGSISYITIQDFDISGPDNSSYGVRVIGSNTKVIGNNIHHIGTTSSCNSGGAISVSNGSYITIDGNVVSDVSPIRSTSGRCNHMHGMYLQGSNVTVTNNIVDQVWQGFGIQVAAGNIVNYMISNNTLFNNGDSRSSFGQSPTGGAFYYECYSGTTCSNLTFQNNVVMENSTSGYYCIFEASGGGAVKGSIYRNNDTYNCGVNIWATGSLTANTNVNPLLVNFLGDGNGDYHLLSSSPLIDQGATSGAPAMDFDGTPRPQGIGIDIGAFEYKDGIQ